MPALDRPTFDRISHLMRASIGLNLGHDKLAMVKFRLSTHLRRLAQPGFAEYVDLIENPANDAEFQVAVDLLTTHETGFFREPQQFDLIEQWLRHRRSRAPLAAWSAACSTGEEPYSLAMLLLDLQDEAVVQEGWTVLATDISERVLRTAAQGIYSTDRVRALGKQRLHRHCLRGEGPAEGQVRMSEELRRCVRFGKLNLLRDISEIGGFDLILMRNVLIYFDAATRAEVTGRVLSALHPGGLLALGASEGRPRSGVALEMLTQGVYRRWMRPEGQRLRG